MRPIKLVLITLTLVIISSLAGCGGSSGGGSSATTVVSTFTATDTATVLVPASTALPQFTFLGPAAVSAVPSTVTIGLNPAGIPLTAAVSGVVAVSAPTLTHSAIAYSGNTAATTTTAGTTNFSGDLFASKVLATLADLLPGLRYANFGEWELLPPPMTTPGIYYVQEYAGGTQLTPASGVPATGTFAGKAAAIGFDNAVNPPEYVLSTGGTAVNLTFTLPNTFTGTIDPIPNSLSFRPALTSPVSGGAFNSLALSGTVSVNVSGNAIFSGTVTTNSDATPGPGDPLALPAGTTGTVSGMFYGPAGNEVSGVYQLTSGSVIIIGSFGAKQ